MTHATHPIHHEFMYRGEQASYRVDTSGWIRVTWNGFTSTSHELKATPAEALALSMLVQMREWRSKFGDDAGGK